MIRSRCACVSVAMLAVLSLSTPSIASPFCLADFNNDSQLDLIDISQFLAAFNNTRAAGDLNSDGEFDFIDISMFINYYTGACPDLTDSDNDRIPDFAETDNGIYLSPTSIGTDPFNPDTDNDGIDDGDEVLGTLQGLILPGANPLRKDIYVECDWFQGVFQGRSENYRPTNAVNSRVVAAFANASTQNPYGRADGITIHLDYGQNASNTGGNQLPGSPDVIQFDSEFNAYKADHFDPRRKGYYHYAIFANRYGNSSNGSSGYAEINGDDFIVTMVNYNSTNNMANTIMHELGHNLGLQHGGYESRNNKVNYNSVMNYRHQFPGIDTTGNTLGNGVLDYSHGVNNQINESAIVESNGVIGIAVDFNRNQIIDAAPYALNLNCSTGTTAPCGSNAGGACADSICGTLNDYDDWDNINWNRLSQSADRQAERPLVQCDNWPGKENE